MKLIYPISHRKLLYVVVDTLIIYGSYVVSFVIRFFPQYNEYFYLLAGAVIPVVIFSYLFPFYFLQAYRIMWAYSNIKDIYRLFVANSLGFISFLSLIALLHLPYSRMVVVLSFFITCGGTIFYRVL